MKNLREAARRAGGSRKGAISELVNTAIQEHLKEVGSKARHEEFRAVRGDEVLARAGSLRELASALKRRRVDPRKVLILSTSPLEPSVRTGLRREVT